MQDLAAWIAPLATMIAAMMTAANLGSRVTGWGFAVFLVGSIAWSVVAILSGQTNLLLTNLFLTLVNIVGVWRWLGRQARYDDSSRAAVERSTESPTPTLLPASGLIGAPLHDSTGGAAGTIVEAMLRCDTGALAYVVVRRGGIGGIGESLHAIQHARLRLSADGATSDVDPETLPPLESEEWPARPC